MMNNKLSWSKILAWTMGLFLCATLVQSLSSCSQGSSKAVAEGERLFVSYCSMCHGQKGDGAMADRLSTPPPDLTMINARHGGKFPEEAVTRQISGKDRLVGHIEDDMPVFWVAIKNGENLTTDEEVEEKIQDIVAYLKSIQRKE